MKTKVGPLAAASISLILGSAGAFAGEPDFHSPTTGRAQNTQPLLARAARAVNAQVHRAGYVSNLWLYPTAEEDEVFAQYVVTTNKASVAGSEQHFELLKIKSDRIAELSDLIRAGDDTLQAKRASGALDWSASIGTGHAMSATVETATPAGSSASPHWSASIGSGQISGDSNRRLYASTGVPASHSPSAHWTAKIGSARATDSNTNKPNGKVTS